MGRRSPRPHRRAGLLRSSRFSHPIGAGFAGSGGAEACSLGRKPQETVPHPPHERRRRDGRPSPPTYRADEPPSPLRGSMGDWWGRVPWGSRPRLHASAPPEPVRRIAIPSASVRPPHRRRRGTGQPRAIGPTVQRLTSLPRRGPGIKPGVSTPGTNAPVPSPSPDGAKAAASEDASCVPSGLDRLF
jgi:hypothetical protein